MAFSLSDILVVEWTTSSNSTYSRLPYSISGMEFNNDPPFLAFSQLMDLDRELEAVWLLVAPTENSPHRWPP